MVGAERFFGIPEVDRPLETAHPAGWLAILVGGTGAGAPVLAKQFASAGVGTSPVLYYTTYERSEDARRAFTEFGWDPTGVKLINLSEEYYERVLVRGLDAARVRERGLAFSDLEVDERQARVPTAFRLTDRILADIAGLDSPFRLVVDSIDFFFEVLPARDVAMIARQIRHRCQTVGGQALLAVHALPHDAAAAGLLEDIADLVVELRAEPKGSRYVHTLLLQKVGYRPDLTRIWKAKLGDGGWAVDGAGSE